MAKKLRDIAGKGQFAGVNKTTVAPPDIDDKNLYQWNAKDGVAFIKKHDTETHDYPHDAEAAFKGKKGGGEKTSKYKFQKDGVYEEIEQLIEKIIVYKGHTLKVGRDGDVKVYKDGKHLKQHYSFSVPDAKTSIDFHHGVKNVEKEETPVSKKNIDEGELDEKYMGFHALKGHLTQTGAKSPAALAAWIGREKYGKEKFQAAAAKGKKLGEGSCNQTNEGVMCEVHGEAACPSGSDKEPRYKGKKMLTDKKHVSEGRVEDVAHKKVTKQLSAIAAASNKPVTKLNPGKKQYNQLKSTGSMFGGARTMAAGLAKRDIEAGQRGSSVAKAKLKEEDIQEVAPPSPKIEKWIKDNKERFVKEYGKEKGMQVLYAKAWKMHGQSESGSATNTDYTGPGAAGWTTGRLDVGTL